MQTESEPIAPEPEAQAKDERIAPWTEIEPGRFQPRRIRGSCIGRALG